jgi:hypothetical protein
LDLERRRYCSNATGYYIHQRRNLDTEDYRRKDRKSINRIKIRAIARTKASTSRQYNRVKIKRSNKRKKENKS